MNKADKLLDVLYEGIFDIADKILQGTENILGKLSKSQKQKIKFQIKNTLKSYKDGNLGTEPITLVDPVGEEAIEEADSVLVRTLLVNIYQAVGDIPRRLQIELVRTLNMIIDRAGI